MSVTIDTVTETRFRQIIRVSRQEKRFQLVEVKNREGESFEAMLRRFTRSVQHEGIISEARRRKAFEPPSVTRKKQIAAKVRKSRKSTEKNR